MLLCRIQFREKVYQGRYTPPSTKWYLQYPGYNGGTDGGSAAVDPQRGILIVNYNDMPNNTRLLTRSQADAKGLEPIDVPHKEPPSGRVEYGAMAGVPYADEVNPGWRVATGLLCTRPPYGGITAIDLATGKVVWKDELPAGGQATPMAFEQDGREYIGFMAGGHHFMHTPVDDYVLAYALPNAG